MGLTNSSTGRGAVDKGIRRTDTLTVALAGNPNVGKSTLFNALTGLRQHTGNWPGKTVALAQGTCRRAGKEMEIVDLPGCYSLRACSREEQVAGDFIREKCADVCVVVCDACCPERGVRLALQIAEHIKRIVLCLNLSDEAEKKGVVTDGKLLSQRMGVPVVFTGAAKKRGLRDLLDAILTVSRTNCTPCGIDRAYVSDITDENDRGSAAVCLTAHYLCDGAVSYTSGKTEKDRRLDRIFTGKYTAFPIMLLLIALVFWLTITAANYPSQWLSVLFGKVGQVLYDVSDTVNAPWWLRGALLDGVYRTVTWVVSVMLPPMALFFPLFSLLEDSGYLPRAAFNVDKCMKSCGACGKQSLTMLMGFGCNAAGVTGCRIIDSPRERLIAVLTNSFVPCNGRFPTLIALITVFFCKEGAAASVLCALFLTALVICSVAASLGVSKLLSVSVLKGLPSSFALELPSYRRPRVAQTIVRSLLDRTLAVLGRAIAAAAPAGLLIWLLGNVTVSGGTLLGRCCAFLDAPAGVMGMDGCILTGFIMGIPANEIAVPSMLMAYTAGSGLTDFGSTRELGRILTENGWNSTTALCTIFFTMFHWPCATTLLTVKKETGSIKWAAAAFILPTVTGAAVCTLINLLMN